jgi:hypothetical protein
MKIPSGMTEQQVMDQISVVCDRISPRYTFYGYTNEDIWQEAFIICIEALNRYDGVRPLENFLSVNLSNRLKTFMRDNYFIGNSNEARKKLAQPSQLDYEDKIIDSETEEDGYEELDFKHMIDAIDKYIPASIRMDYLKIINDIYITKQRREEVIEIIKGILEEHGFHEERQDQ